MNLYGFGPAAAPDQRPSAQAVEAARRQVGYDYLEFRREPPALRKRRALYVDLSAVAKGYGVDAVSAALAKLGCPSHMVEIGGEVFAAGSKPDGAAWRIGVEVPDSVPGTAIGKVVYLRNVAVATSGDYRNYIEWDGNRYSHTFDARTGASVAHGLASVT
ncbi:MAG: FAD:protein FMN transferase [Gammaproteobacteria bacterium]|nr:FAD:protein FMN transferase [Gammaproteobacteria bacterium]